MVETYFRPSARPCVRPSVRPSDRPSVRPFVRPSVRPFVRLSRGGRGTPVGLPWGPVGAVVLPWGSREDPGDV